MLTVVVAHAGQPAAPHDLWTAWNADPLLVAGFLLALWVYRRGRAGGRPRRADAWRARCFTAALVALAVALLSPLDSLSGALASAHMVQHLLLVVVAAPLLALSAPSSTLLRGSPLVVRRATGRWGRRLRRHTDVVAAVRHPATAWLLHVATLWFWHAAVPYGAALDHELVHAAEHASFLLTGVLFWHAVIGIRGAARVPKGLGVLLIFAMALQGVFLSALLTFARAPWYARYEATAPLWGLDALADQQLAGVLMWIPAGLVYLAAALSLLARWLQDMERRDTSSETDRQGSMVSETGLRTGPTGNRTGVRIDEEVAVERNPEKDPERWVTGEEPMTGPQQSYLSTLAQEVGEPPAPPDLSKAEASERIDALQERTDRG